MHGLNVLLTLSKIGGQGFNAQWLRVSASIVNVKDSFPLKDEFVFTLVTRYIETHK